MHVSMLILVPTLNLITVFVFANTLPAHIYVCTYFYSYAHKYFSTPYNYIEKIPKCIKG